MQINVPKLEPTRISDVRIMAGQKSTFELNFNASIDVGRTISSVKWSSDSSFAFTHDDGSILNDARSTTVNLTGTDGGAGFLRCEATLDNGDVAVHTSRIAVKELFA